MYLRVKCPSKWTAVGGMQKAHDVLRKNCPLVTVHGEYFQNKKTNLVTDVKAVIEDLDEVSSHAS